MDVKRLAASFAVAARNNGFKDKKAARAARSAVAAAYRTTMADLAALPTLQVWFAEVDVDLLVERLRKTSLREATVKAGSKARRSTGDTAVLKLTETVDGQRRFRHDPPLLVPVPPAEFDEVLALLVPVYEQYLKTLSPDRIALLMKYSFVDVAHKVVGVGSVGTRALVLLLESGDVLQKLLELNYANHKRQYGCDFISAMPTNLYGPNDNYDLNNSHVLPALIRKFHEAKINNVPQVVMWGTGSPFREFLHADDLASALYFLMQNYDGEEFVNLAVVLKSQSKI